KPSRLRAQSSTGCDNEELKPYHSGEDVQKIRVSSVEFELPDCGLGRIQKLRRADSQCRSIANKGAQATAAPSSPRTCAEAARVATRPPKDCSSTIEELFYS